MKVICIRDDWKENIVGPNNPMVGDIDEVINVYCEDSIVAYVLKGRSNPHGYWVGCFAPLSSIDETEMIREYNHEPATNIF